MTTDCPFCARIAAGEYDCVYDELTTSAVVTFEPLNPVTPGHRLFVPVTHTEHPAVPSAMRALQWAAIHAHTSGESYNLIVSYGAAATQTIPHIHVHYVPRRDGDTLALPWTGQVRS